MKSLRVSAIALVVVAFALLMLGCRDDEPMMVINTLTPGLPATTAPEVTITAGPTSTVSPGAACPLATVACTLAGQLESQLSAGNVAAIADINLTQSFTCPGGRPLGAGGPFPLCEGAPAGESRTGYQVARRYSEGAVLSRAAYEQFLTQQLQQVNAGAADANGSGALKLHAVGCVDQPATPSTCTHFTVIFSAIFGDKREVLVFFVRTAAPAPQITSTWNGVIQPDEVPIIFGLQGGTLFDLGRVFPLPR